MSLRMEPKGSKNLSNLVDFQELKFNLPESIFRSEIEFLEQAVIKEREKYQMSTQALSTGLSAIPVMTVNDSVCNKFMSII